MRLGECVGVCAQYSKFFVNSVASCFIALKKIVERGQVILSVVSLVLRTILHSPPTHYRVIVLRFLRKVKFSNHCSTNKNVT